MTEKQKKFCIEYLKDLNATQAAIRAGYSKDTAKVIGCENLTKPDIKNHLDKQLNDIMEASKSSLKKRIVDELETMAFDPMTDEDSKLRHSDKIKSIELLGKYAELFKDQITVNVDTAVVEALKEKYQNK